MACEQVAKRQTFETPKIGITPPSGPPPWRAKAPLPFCAVATTP